MAASFLASSSAAQPACSPSRMASSVSFESFGLRGRAWYETQGSVPETHGDAVLRDSVLEPTLLVLEICMSLAFAPEGRRRLRRQFCALRDAGVEGGQEMLPALCRSCAQAARPPSACPPGSAETCVSAGDGTATEG
eukprot:1514640-Rhodomonas_salina.2